MSNSEATVESSMKCNARGSMVRPLQENTPLNSGEALHTSLAYDGRENDFVGLGKNARFAKNGILFDSFTSLRSLNKRMHNLLEGTRHAY